MDIQQTVWNEFVQGNERKPAMLSEIIAESWQYCRSQEVNPYSTKGSAKIELVTLKQRTKHHERLIALIQSEISRYQPLFQVKRPIFILTDKDGCIIWREGNQETKAIANDITFKEGSIWTEKAVGTNAIGITLRTNQGVTVHGFEHYAMASHPFTCSSVPIRNEEADLIGCLDVSSFETKTFDQYTLLALQLISKNVQERLIRENLERKKALFEYVLGTTKIGVICDDANRIVKISDELELDHVEWLGKSINALQSVTTLSKIGETITYDEGVIGYFYARQKETAQQTFHVFGVPSQNAAYRQFLLQLKKVSTSFLPVHIYGESGSGKELAAKMIHRNSPVSEGPILAVNCGAMTESLLESELFGYAGGAFTGAQSKGYKGKIEQAHGGTLFLDEIDSMSKSMQAALLRILEDKVVTPLGSEKTVAVNFRIITASNQDLRQLVKEERFRLDLFYRLYVAPLRIPPLRERQEDLAVLIDAFCHEKNWYPSWIKRVEAVAKAYRWEGNIRELRNFLERLFLYYEEQEPTEAELREMIAIGSLSSLSEALETKPLEQVRIEEALVNYHYHLTKTAKALGIARSTLYRRIEQFQIDLPQ